VPKKGRKIDFKLALSFELLIYNLEQRRVDFIIRKEIFKGGKMISNFVYLLYKNCLAS